MMNDFDLFAILILGGFIAFFLGRNKAYHWQASQSSATLHSLPNYYGYMVGLWSTMPALVVFVLWSFLQSNIISTMVVANYQSLEQLSEAELSLALNEIHALASGAISTSQNALDLSAAVLYANYVNYSFILKAIVSFATVLLGFLISYAKMTPSTRARNNVENIMIYGLFSCALIAIFTTIGIVFSLLFESLEFFAQIPILDFLFGIHWSPQIAIREDQYSSAGAFGMLPIFWGTIFISLIAMLVAAPLGLISAIYLAEYASHSTRLIIKPILEILAGIPTVVYGFFAALTVAPMVRDFGNVLHELGVNLEIELLTNITVSTESVLAAGLVMGMMIVPFILSLSDDVISAVPDAMRDGSTAMGATHRETVWKVVIPAALPGIVGAFLLAISRAIGETMIVLMAAGVAANLTANPLASVTTVTTQIVVLLTGDQEFDSPRTLAAFALGLGLFIITLALNALALHIVRKYREQYE